MDFLDHTPLKSGSKPLLREPSGAKRIAELEARVAGLEDVAASAVDSLAAAERRVAELDAGGVPTYHEAYEFVSKWLWESRERKSGGMAWQNMALAVSTALFPVVSVFLPAIF